jgi:hypothetical protein
MHVLRNGLAWLIGLALAAVNSGALAADFAVEKSEAGAKVIVDGALLAEYIVKSGHQPVIWPIIGTQGAPMTRQYPLGPKLPTERDDHPHHRSLWFSHGSVNDKDFWMEPRKDGPPEKNNQIVHREFVEMAAEGGKARLVTRNDWVSGKQKICEDLRAIEFGADEHGRWIDFAIELKATEGPLTFGDTKEGTFALRVPGTMDVDAKLGGKIVNSRGQSDADAWGHSADWVDYHGPVEGQPAGIVILDLPDSFRHPTRWHVRTYGLFAANPFGQEGFDVEDVKQGAAKLAKGESLRLHYRVLFYSGERTPEQIAAIYQQYAAAAAAPAAKAP